MGSLHPLEDLQRLDSYADELSARRSALPERAACAAREAEIATVVSARGENDGRRVALRREERRVEGAVADFEARAREVEAKLYSGQVRAIKELEALQLELQVHRRHQGEQEDAELALMEEEERSTAEIAALDARRATLEAELATMRATLAAAEGAIDAELAAVASARAGVAAAIDPSVLATYERLRAAPALRGRSVASIADAACTGCRSVLPIAFVSGLARAPAGATPTCPRCGRLLVR